MGEQNEQKELVFQVNGVGYSPILFSEIHTLSDLMSEADEETVFKNYFNFDGDFKAIIKPLKRYTATNRKRFVKLCMADGESRNFANELAEVVYENRKDRMSYKFQYLMMVVGAGLLEDGLRSKIKAMERLNS